MKIDDITFDRVMDETPINEIEAIWRNSGFIAAKKWCEAARVMGRKEGFGVGIISTMIFTTIINIALVLLEADRTWVSVLVPFAITLIAFTGLTGMIANHQLFMYGKANKCDSEEHNASADDKPSNEPTAE